MRNKDGIDGIEVISMDLFIARQPIFEINGDVYGYKLLYREVGEESYSCVNGDLATSSVIAGNFLSTALESTTGGKKAFINFTESFLTMDIATLFPSEYLVVEVMETDTAIEKVINACTRIKSLGYMIAVGDFVFKSDFAELLKLADIVKVDFLAKSDQEKIDIIRKNRDGKTKFLAEKVESHEDYKKAIEWGYNYFQGYFFSKPEIVSSKTIHPSKWSQIRLMSVVNEKKIDFAKIAEVIEMDPAFSYEILRIVNSSYFSRGATIKTIKHALIRLGIADVKKWCYITALRKQGDKKYDEVVAMSMIRAKFLELFSSLLGTIHNSSEYITVGILSSLDILLGSPMETILQEMHLSEDIANALLGKNDEAVLSQSYRLILECEKGNWPQVATISKTLGVGFGQIAELHNEAIKWVVEFEKELAHN